MKRALLRGFGIALLIWGVVLFFVPGVSLTGFTIVEDVGLKARSILGTILILGGVFLAGAAQRLRQNTTKTLADIVKGTTPVGRSTIVFPDTNFVKGIRDEGYQLPPHFFGNTPHAFLDKVMDEMHHRQGDQPRVDGSTIKYYTNHLKTGVLKYEPQEETVRYVTSVYKRTNIKGGSLTDNAHKFEHGADVRFLCYAVEHPHQNVIILSNDNDVKETAKRLNAEKRATIEVIDSKQVR